MVQKWPFFQHFFFRQYRQEKCLLRYSRTKNRLFFFYDILKRKNAYLGYKKKEVQKVEKLPMVLVRKWPFFNISFLSNIGQENVFYDILQRKSAFLRYKKKKFKKSKKWHFSKGVNPWFWSNKGHFSNIFFFSQYRQEKYLLRYSRTKKRLSRL